MTIYDVFISYRRSDGMAIAEALNDYLTSKGLRVFFDKSEIKDSEDFKARIQSSLIQAPNYLLVATTEAFNFYDESEKKDWVKREMEIACENYDENTGRNRVITVVAPNGAKIPNEVGLPENIRILANPNRITLKGAIPDDDDKLRILKAVTKVTRHNLWNAAHRWFEESREKGGRFAALDINASLFPNAEKSENEPTSRDFPIYVLSGDSTKKTPLMQALAENKNHIYLIGQGGIGKTTSLLHIMKEAYEGRSYIENCQIPLYVSLSTAPDTAGELYKGGRSTFIKRAVYKQVREDRTVKRVTKIELAQLDEAFTIDPETAVNPIIDIFTKESSAPEYLLLLDGLNEVSRTYIEESNRTVIDMIKLEINELMEKCPNVRVIVTGRADEALINDEKLTRLNLSGVEDSVIRQYLSDSKCGEDKINHVFENDSLLETLRIPLFLIMYASLNDAAEITTQGEILRTFFNERQSRLCDYTVQNRLSEVEHDVDTAASAKTKTRITADMQCFMLDFLLPEIAWCMEQRDKFYIFSEDIGDIIESVLTGTGDGDICGRYGKTIFDKYHVGSSSKTHTRATAKDIREALGSDMDELTENFIDCCVLSLGILSMSNGKYGFIHQHIRDYFASQKVINQMWLAVCCYEDEQKDTAYECIGQVLRKKPLSITLRRFVGESLGEHKNAPQFIDGHWKYMVPEELCERSLIARTLDVLRGVKCTDEYDLYNLIRILAESRGDLSGENLSGLDFTRCSLNDIRLSRPGLSVDLTDALVTKEKLFPQNHMGRISGCCINSDKNQIITCSADGKIKVWDLFSSECLRTIDAHEGAIYSLKYIPQKNIYISSSSDNTIKIWSADTFECCKTIDGFSEPLIFSISNNGEMFCVVEYLISMTSEISMNSESVISIYDTSNFSLTSNFKTTGKYPHDITFSYDNQNIYIISNIWYKEIGKYKFRIQCWSLSEKKCISSFDYPLCDYACYCNDNKNLIMIESGIVRVWDIRTNECMYRKKASVNDFRDAAASPNGKNIVFCHNNKTVTICDTNSIEKVASAGTNGTYERFNHVQYSDDGKYIIAIGFDFIYVLETTTYTCVAVIKSYQIAVDYAEFSKSGDKMLILPRDNTVKIFDRNSNKQYIMNGIMYEQNLNLYPKVCRFSTDAKRVILCSLCKKYSYSEEYNYSASNWDVESLLKISEHCFNKTRWEFFEYNPDSDDLVIKYPDRLEIVDSKDYSTHMMINKDKNFEYHADGKYLIGTYDNVIKIYDINTTQYIGEITADSEIQGIKFSPDGKIIATTCANHKNKSLIQIWNAKTYQIIKTIIVQTTYYYHFSCYDIKYDSSQLLSTSTDTVEIWDLNTYQCIARLKHDDKITSAHYSPDGDLIVTSSSDGMVKLWDAETFECVQTIPNIPGLFVQGVDLRKLAPGSAFSEEDKDILRTYGALID